MSKITSAVLLSLCLAAVAQEGAKLKQGPLPLANPGFEERGSGWSQPSLQTSGISFIEEAAKSGKLGLRVTDMEEAGDVTLRAEPIAIAPDSKLRVGFAGRSVDGGRGFNLFVRFLDSNKVPIQLPEGKRFHFMLTEEHREWGRCCQHS